MNSNDFIVSVKFLSAINNNARKWKTHRGPHPFLDSLMHRCKGDLEIFAQPSRHSVMIDIWLRKQTTGTSASDLTWGSSMETLTDKRKDSA